MERLGGGWLDWKAQTSVSDGGLGVFKGVVLEKTWICIPNEGDLLHNLLIFYSSIQFKRQNVFLVS